MFVSMRPKLVIIIMMAVLLILVLSYSFGWCGEQLPGSGSLASGSSDGCLKCKSCVDFSGGPLPGTY